MDEYAKLSGPSPGIVTGKPLDLFGSLGREASRTPVMMRGGCVRVHCCPRALEAGGPGR